MLVPENKQELFALLDDERNTKVDPQTQDRACLSLIDQSLKTNLDLEKNIGMSPSEIFNEYRNSRDK